MSLARVLRRPDLTEPVVVVAFDAWVDAGSASTAAAQVVAEGGETLIEFDPDLLYDFRARRPTLRIKDGRPDDLTWPALTIRHRRIDERDLLVLTGPEPDYRWQEIARLSAEIARDLGVTQWLSLGAIPAAVPHTRPVPVLGTQSQDGLLRGGIEPGPAGLLQVPAAAISVVDLAVSAAGIPAVGYFAQVPHYVSGEYPAAATALLAALGQHLGVELEAPVLELDARTMRTRLDAAASAEDATRSYIERLEQMVDEARQPVGSELISEIERFLRDRGEPGGPVH
jgi:proteasome assembly chaperone (PAC2) family protein